MTNFTEAWVDFIAGWASGAASVVMCQPLDTVLTRLQANSMNNSNNSAKTVAAATTTTTTTTATTATISPTHSINSNNIKGMTSAQTIFRNMVSSTGVSSLWRGASPMISVVPFQNSLLMGGYGMGKQWAEQNNNVYDTNSDTSPSSNYYNSVLIPIFIGGCTGGIVQSFLVSPVEWIKIRTQVAVATAATTTTTGIGGPQQQQPVREMMTTWKAAQQLLARPTSVMKCGLSATLWRDGIPHGVWFASYEWCKSVLETQQQQHNNSIVNILNNDVESDDNNARYIVSLSSETHRQLTIPLVSGAFAATMAWVRMFLSFCVLVVVFSIARGGC
jgi:solute carrier family 25 (mitochondrial carnitine/acylcarnitine transporter), member 20/29